MPALFAHCQPRSCGDIEQNQRKLTANNKNEIINSEYYKNYKPKL